MGFVFTALCYAGLNFLIWKLSNHDSRPFWSLAGCVAIGFAAMVFALGSAAHLGIDTNGKDSYPVITGSILFSALISLYGFQRRLKLNK